MNHPKPRIHLVLGSGGARGLAHIGVIRGIEASGYQIASITGCSMGAVVGGMYAAGFLTEYESWLYTLTRAKVWSFLDLTLTKQGFVKGERIIAQLKEFAGEQQIEKLPIPFTAVATDLVQRTEVIYQQGDLYKALRASIGIPGVFTPVSEENSFLVDGGVLNPLPLNLAPRISGEPIIAVNLNGHPTDSKGNPNKNEPSSDSWLSKLLPQTASKKTATTTPNYSIVDLISTSYDFTAYRLVELLCKTHPPNLLIQIPRNICGSFDFHKASTLIEFGKQAWKDQLPQLVQPVGYGFR